MKKLNFLVTIFCLMIGGMSIAQTSTEQFETESNGFSSFTDNGVIFNISSHVGTFDVQANFPGTGWNGAANDNRYIDNSNSTESPASFSIKTASNLFKVNKFWMYLSALNLDLTISGTLNITGKLSGVTKFDQTKSTGFTTSMTPTNGYTLIDLTNLNGQNFSNIIIDELQITLGGLYRYARLDAFTWVKDTGIINALTVSSGSQTNVSCFGSSNGSATVNVSGGTAPYNYSWSSSSSITATATGLAAGTHTVTVTDAVNVSKIQSFSITQPAAINVATTGNTTCAGNSANLIATGADQYFWYKQIGDINPNYVGSDFTTPAILANTTYYVEGAKLSPQKTLETTFLAGNNHRGNMINVTAQKDLVISSFDVSPMGNTTIEVYYKEGTYTGFESTPSAWTLLGSAPVIYTGNPVKATVGNLRIPAGKTYALYITSSLVNVALNYTNLNSNQTYQDDNMTIEAGIGLEYPFTDGTGALYNPRAWNGRINYELLECIGGRQPVDVNVNTVAAPSGNATQSFNAGDNLGLLTVNGQGIKWYATATDASSHINELPSTTIIINNTTYYATQTVVDCESIASLAVKAYNETLSVSDLQKKSTVTLYPNPVKQILNLTSESKINKIIISDFSGRKVLEKSLNGENRIDVQSLTAGTYLIQIFTENDVETTKFIKV